MVLELPREIVLMRVKDPVLELTQLKLLSELRPKVKLLLSVLSSPEPQITLLLDQVHMTTNSLCRFTQVLAGRLELQREMMKKN